ncbi:LuxR C-terminal-related transcriptional regulator [Flexithrix dorotheae]|uniref:LuxR C-terminal-related transcriptional regulator n=1 Tax=Flexithrix dorotheae TaxID=70993 RepID=UPI00035C5C30|nr:LuxR C-terminal-related transcriptional regulator [Flexithrix dorotheae]
MDEEKKKAIDKLKMLWREKTPLTNMVEGYPEEAILHQIASFFAPGSYYYYIFNFSTLQIEYVHPNVESVLGLKPIEFTVEKILSLYHPEDLEMMHKKEKLAIDFLFNYLPPGDIIKYKCVYLNRIRKTDNTYTTILHQAKAISLDENGRIQKVLGVHTDITYLSPTIDHKISFIAETKPSFYSLDPNVPKFEKITNSNFFTTRELEIIQLLSEGKSTKEIADFLSVSIHTISTHKKNILKKSKAANTTQLIADCIRNGII